MPNSLFDGDTLDYTLSITVEVDDSKPDDSTSSTLSPCIDGHRDQEEPC